MSDLFLRIMRAVDDTTERVIEGLDAYLHFNQPLKTFNATFL